MAGSGPAAGYAWKAIGVSVAGTPRTLLVDAVGTTFSRLVVLCSRTEATRLIWPVMA